MSKKFSKIEDPQNCPIEELEAEVERLKDVYEYYEAKQLALKTFLNSVYGACASQYFIGHNIDVAESITLQGQNLNHYSENCLNRYFDGIFQKDVELYKKLGIDPEKAAKVDIGTGRDSKPKPCVGEEFSYLENPKSLTVMGDTDSVCGESIVEMNGSKMPIKDLWDVFEYLEGRNKKKTDGGAEVIPLFDKFIVTPAYNTKTNKVEEAYINYIMRHKVSKGQYEIKSKDGHSVKVTEDHSCMVYRDGKVIAVKPKDINPKTDKLVIYES